MFTNNLSKFLNISSFSGSIKTLAAVFALVVMISTGSSASASNYFYDFTMTTPPAGDLLSPTISFFTGSPPVTIDLTGYIISSSTPFTQPPQAGTPGTTSQAFDLYQNTQLSNPIGLGVNFMTLHTEIDNFLSLFQPPFNKGALIQIDLNAFSLIPFSSIVLDMDNVFGGEWLAYWSSVAGGYDGSLAQSGSSNGLSNPLDLSGRARYLDIIVNGSNTSAVLSGLAITTESTNVPEPATIGILGSALAIAALRRKLARKEC